MGECGGVKCMCTTSSSVEVSDFVLMPLFYLDLYIYNKIFVNDFLGGWQFFEEKCMVVSRELF